MKDIESNTTGIFQTPVYITKLRKKFSQKELDFIINHDKDSRAKIGLNPKSTLLAKRNFGSENKHVLDQKQFKNLKKELELILQDYFDKIICPANDIVPYITQSWLNYSEPGKFHHEHNHPNSYVSGVVYIQCHETLDKISFVNHDYKMIRPETKEYNVFNSVQWTIPVKTNDVILFPSSLPHCVPPNEGDKIRISLSFNTFIKGTVGLMNSATGLILK
tara:strand:+ start:73 stop:729 length:657 start_codon:yes stop_codon:yes gene_type:complete